MKGRLVKVNLEENEIASLNNYIKRSGLKQEVYLANAIRKQIKAEERKDKYAAVSNG